MYNTDCFAYCRKYSKALNTSYFHCSCLNVNSCDNCHFYKTKLEKIQDDEKVKAYYESKRK